MPRTVLAFASLLALVSLSAAVGVGCGPDTGNCTGACQGAANACPLTAQSVSECESECSVALDGAYNKGDSCGQAYDALLVCEKTAAYMCDIEGTPPSNCTDQQQTYDNCGLR